MATVDAGAGLHAKAPRSAVQRSASTDSPTTTDTTPELPDAQSAHVKDFKQRTGMTPEACYWLFVLSLMLRVVGGCWMAMVTVEYARYYVINDLRVIDVVRTATNSPQFAVQAFLFPFWGVVSDRVSRKKIVVVASLATCASSWLVTLFPSVPVYVLTKVLALVADVGGPIRVAMLRDILTTYEWETLHGGATGVASRMLLFGIVAGAVATVVAMALMKLGDYGYGLPNEYTLHKHECGEEYCLPLGHWSWDGPWMIEGSLRLLMMMGAVVKTADTILVCFFFPETLPPAFRREASLWRFLRSTWHDSCRPWKNLRVLATSQLRSLMTICCLCNIILAGGGSLFMVYYSRFEFDSFTMSLHVVIGGISTWLATAAVSCLVDRYGDLKGVWVPGSILLLLHGISTAFLPPGYGFMVYAISPLFTGPGAAFGGMAPVLLTKLVPPDLQGTFQTAQSFVFLLTMAVFMWPWNQLFLQTHGLGYPLDGIPLWISIFIGLVMLCLTLRMLRDDPQAAIREGRALEAFWESAYARREGLGRPGGKAAGAEAAPPQAGLEAGTADEPPQQTLAVQTPEPWSTPESEGVSEI
mmetsp:Transcript_39853/g.114822  ORF Transcript_39853/g.114822 Transcript_39853/m.114822 type:complete len:584 (-) Transcript_39853:49-1800(-)